MASAGNEISHPQPVHPTVLPIMSHASRNSRSFPQVHTPPLPTTMGWTHWSNTTTLNKKQLHHTIQGQLIQGIRSIMTDNTHPPTDVNPHTTHCSWQQQIGWKQIIYGQYLQQWIAAINNQEPPINGHQLITKVIHLTWQQIAAQWTVHNSHMHPTTAHKADHSRLRATLLQIIHEAQQHPHLAAMIEHANIDNLMAWPTKQIQQFITRSHDHIQDHNQAEAKRARLHMHDIRTYFQRQVQQPTAMATDKNLLRPP